jgi:hypothetical protein
MARLTGKISDSSGKPLPGATIDWHVPGREHQRATADASGKDALFFCPRLNRAVFSSQPANYPTTVSTSAQAAN